jgi:hypothetical protein
VDCLGWFFSSFKNNLFGLKVFKKSGDMPIPTVQLFEWVWHTGYHFLSHEIRDIHFDKIKTGATHFIESLPSRWLAPVDVSQP